MDKIMIKVIEKKTGNQFMAEAIDGGYRIFTEGGELYKKLKESTFKCNFKVVVSKADSTPKAEATEELDEEKREKMIDKIKKMLTLAENNPSLEEGLQAALHAQKLMAKYNIHKDEVTLEEIKEEIGSVFTEQKHNSHLMAWRKVLATIVARNFRCKCYLSGKDVVFRGYINDAKIAQEVYLNLYRIGDKLACKACTEQHERLGHVKGAYNSFTAGFLSGIQEGLSAQCTALMIIVPKEVEEEFQEFSASFRTSKNKISITDYELYQKGKVEGKAAVKARGLEDKEGKK